MKTLLAQLASLVITYLVDKVPDAEILTYGERSGKWLTDNVRKLMGGSWERIEDKLQNKFAVFCAGLHKGVDYDD